MDGSPAPPAEAVAATFKVLVLGDSNVGKSSLISSFYTGSRPRRLVPTVGVDFTDIVVSVRGTKVKLRIWDTAGQEKFHTFTKQFFRGTQGIILVYDITDMNSFNMLRKWNRTVTEAGLLDVSLLIVGNKSDLEDRRTVPTENAEQIALQNYKAQSIETSVTTGKNVKKAFYNLAESLIFSHNIFQPGREATATSSGEESNIVYSIINSNSPADHLPGRSDSLRLGHSPQLQKKDKKCCSQSS